MTRRHILVTGGAGYIGSHMTLALLGAGERPLVIDNLSTGSRAIVPTDVPFFEGNVGDADFVGRIMDEHPIEAIIHFAASIVVPESVTQPLAYYGNNTANARTLLECAVNHGVPHVVFSSTAAVYGEPDRTPVEEDDPTRPINPYGRSKLMVEWMLADIAQAYPFSYAALRYFNVAGADPQGRAGQSTPNATHLIKIAVQAALGKRSGLDVYGTDYSTPDGSCIRDYVHVSDLAQAHLDALDYLRAGKPSITCNIGYANGYSVLDVINVVKRVSGVDFEVRIKGRRAGDPAALIAANQRARTALSWTPRYDDLEQIVRDALAWERRLG
ncbi:UDP-glucose 4-epimerase GalE [Rhodopseudomonas palustris]|uniref:UDP-glucose 4-epimerase n=1 Tax=Rhodopseudomonas palustris (strain ATCC BAA-98 / CGA009) TaxID=258594 RepID=Q6N127_RHOPA|nr:UDP-glucose 4-epimerase GalE [Rhodopseudomonas palustris]ACF03551.1 UDP-glucose 4-epimerase [Rhodopseudomonas palustris TIE-1]OPF96160.1 UDP-glucose 4-epimerase GalE [Rhodopseudomonas palustris]PPQ41257.1 UDP-glucose 4-epimerase GalE [Rhodopseudomonas palustris]QQM06157.1 UDP-glucose 4-epimerase [Rhodopseudomonas palustris]RJF66744.1 UDP-glucose 4-epimerase GalE [Rhodopseudomonas palustris]